MIIIDTQMPIGCINCRFKDLYDDSNGFLRYECMLLNAPIDNNNCQRPPACPIKGEVPKGHGRLGDLDALESEMINGIKAGNYEEGYENYSHILNVDDCVECVRYAETIIEADKEGEEV